MIAFEYLAFVQASATGAILDEWAIADAVPGEYALAEYAPVIAPARRSRLGGSGAWGDVEDALTVHVVGGTAAQCVAALDRLVGALDAAGRWAAEETSDVIQIRARVAGSTAGELAAVVLGPVDGEPPATVAPEWDQAAGHWIIRDVQLRFRRRGLWLSPAVESGTGTTVVIGEVSVVALSNHATLSPCRLIAESITLNDSGFGYLLGAASESQFQIINAGPQTASVGTAGAALSVVDAAGNYSRSGNVLRFTAASPATDMRVETAVATTIPSRYSTVHLFCNVRPGSATPAWDLQVRHYDETGFNVYQEGPRVAVPRTTAVTPMYLGTVGRVEQWGRFQLVARVATGAYPETLDIDTLVLLAEDESTTILGVFDGRTIQMIVTPPLTWSMSADGRPLTAPAPIVSSRTSTDLLRYPLQARGDAYPQQRGATMAALFYLNAVSSTSRWRALNNTATGPGTMRLLTRRYRGWRTPQ